MKTHFPTRKPSSRSKNPLAPKSPSSYTFDPIALKKSLTRDARALGIPMGSAEAFIERTVNDVVKSLKSEQTPTESGVNRAVIREMKKYSPDFVFYLQHRDQII